MWDLHENLLSTSNIVERPESVCVCVCVRVCVFATLFIHYEALVTHLAP